MLHVVRELAQHWGAIWFAPWARLEPAPEGTQGKCNLGKPLEVQPLRFGVKSCRVHLSPSLVVAQPVMGLARLWIGTSLWPVSRRGNLCVSLSPVKNLQHVWDLRVVARAVLGVMGSCWHLEACLGASAELRGGGIPGAEIRGAELVCAG